MKRSQFPFFVTLFFFVLTAAVRYLSLLIAALGAAGSTASAPAALVASTLEGGYLPSSTSADSRVSCTRCYLWVDRQHARHLKGTPEHFKLCRYCYEDLHAVQLRSGRRYYNKHLDK